jgi:hypothetical protein
MPEPVPTERDVSAGTYQCANCGTELKLASGPSLPPCPECQETSFEAVTSGDTAEDPHAD